MTETKLDRPIIFILRIMMGWTFLYAGTWQVSENCRNDPVRRPTRFSVVNDILGS